MHVYSVYIYVCMFHLSLEQAMIGPPSVNYFKPSWETFTDDGRRKVA